MSMKCYLKKVFSSLSLLLLSVLVHGQEKYHIVDAQNGEPLPYVCMYVSEGRGAWSNEDGDAELIIGEGEQVKISCVGYKTLVLKKSELTSTIRMTQLSRDLLEVNVESDVALLLRAAKKLNKDAVDNRRYRVPFFSRITIQSPARSEMVECFMEAGSASAIHYIKLYNGLYYSLSESGESQSSLRDTDIHNVFCLAPNTENDAFWKGYEGPLHQGVTAGWLRKSYTMSSEIYNSDDGNGLRCITLKPKRKEKMIWGKLYVRPLSGELVCFEGQTETNLTVDYIGRDSEQSHPTLDFRINYTTRNGFSEVDNMSFSIATNDVKCHSTMINMGSYNFNDVLTWPVELGKNLVETLDDTGHNPALDKYLSIMKRTDDEALLTQRLYAISNAEESSNGNAATSLSSKWMNALPQEKVYLHLDNTGYFKGETIWFKAYVVRTDTERRGNLSSVLYVDLVSPKGDVIAHKKIYVTHGIGAGSITLDNAVMPTGFYELRAYTRYMMGWSDNSCFSRIIPVFREPRKKGDFTPQLDKQTYLTAQETEKEEKRAFYPEGGNLVKGLPSRIAYIIKGKRGVVDVPASEDHSSVQIDIDGSSRTYSLPKALDEGISLRVDALRDDSLQMDIWATSGMKDKELGYVLIHSGKIITSAEFKTGAHQRFSISRDVLPDGVSQITVFDPEGGALADRFVFRCPEYKDSLQIHNTTTTLLPCGKVSMDITSTPYTSLSFSAIDANSTVNGKHGDIKTWMLLGSDIRGYIANPEYYFESDDTEHRKAADLLMLIQGWRRYDWNTMNQGSAIANGNIREKLQPYESKLAIDGTIKAKKGTNADVAGVTITATLHGGSESFGVSAVTDSTGYYTLVLPDIQGEWAMSLSASQNGISDKYIIPINRHFTPTTRHPEEYEAKQIPMDDLQIHHWDIPDENASVWKKFLDARGTIMREVTVKKSKRDNFDWSGFSDEKNAQINSTLYYDCEKAVEDYLDHGEEPPSLAEWLTSKDKMFKGNTPTDKALWAAVGDTTRMAKDDDIFLPGMIFDVGDLTYFDWKFKRDYSNYENIAPSYWVPVWRDGLEINGRPVVWMVNNQYCTITNLHLRTSTSVYDYLENMNGSTGALDLGSIRDQLTRKGVRRAPTIGQLSRPTVDIPTLLEDLKSLYISEDQNLAYQITTSSDIQSTNPYVIYCYTKQGYGKRKVKGIRYTSFQGFDPVEVFRTEDYDEMPPMDDFRRTLYWNPNLWTDKNGKAHVEFWNNSTCTDMIISAEGVTDDGKFVIGK